MYALLDFNYSNLIYFFAFYSFLGWCIEVLYYFKNEHRFVNRGFLFGPFCPIYGCGVLSLVLFLDNYRNNLLLLFILACILTTVLEYYTGYLLEKIFKTKWWDYSQDPFNLHGRVCLHYSLLWGVGEIFILKILHPMVVNSINNIPQVAGDLLLSIFVIYFLIDFCFTISSLMQFNKISFAFQFAQENFFFEKPGILFSSTKEKAMDTIRNFENLFGRIKYNFSNLSYRPFTLIIKSLKDKLKKD